MYAPDNQGTLWAFAGDGTRLWSAPGTIGDYTVPSVGADGTIYVDDLLSMLTAIHPDGGGYWSKPLDAGTGIGSVVIAPDGTLRVSGQDGYLYALDPKSGAEKWRAYVDDSGLGGMAIWDDGTTYVGTRTQIVGVDAAGNPAGNLAVTGGTYIPIIDANGIVYSTCNNGASLCAFNHALTQTLWQATPTPPAVIPSAGSPVIGPGGMVYFIAGETYGSGFVYAFGPP
jgi:outer membrane protein assembly factor BamB